MNHDSFSPPDMLQSTRGHTSCGIGFAEYRFLIERNADGIVVVDLQGLVVFANPAAAEIFGRAVDALVGQPIGVPISAGETTEIVILRPQGGRTDVEMRVVAATWDGQPTLLASLRDISARREMEERKRQSHKMEAVGRLTAGIAHDFNNLLTVVIGNLELLQHLADKEENPRLIRHADYAMQGARRAATLTQQLLAFSRRQPLLPRPVDVNQLLRGMGELMSRTLGEIIHVDQRLDDDLPPILVDSNQLETAILNLAMNARDAMPLGGTLTLETRPAVFTEEAGPDLAGKPCVRVTVKDTGCGMSEETLANVFEPFFTTKGVGKGTGLGLSQVYGFVTQSGGAIGIDTAPGQGAAIHLYLLPTDRKPRHKAENEAAEAELPKRSGSTVLVVDSADARAHSVSALRDIGHSVIEAKDGSSALLELDRSPDIRMLFSDVDLPGSMNGYELAQAACARRPQVQVLLTTSHPGDTAVKDSCLASRLHFLAKPFTHGTFASTVDQLLRVPQKTPVILLVEDNSLVRMTIVETLLDAGYRVEEAATATEAIKKIRLDHVHLDAAVIDFGLPDGNGAALVSELRAARAQMPIVVASGYNPEKTAPHSEDGRLVFLDKPFDGAELRRILTSLGVLAT